MSVFHEYRMVRKLKGPVKKESKKERRERRQENTKGKERIATNAVPVLLGLAALLAVFIWLAAQKGSA